ncbi:uncharacterized protein LOC107268394 isoform X2 [Cephus cinctus]|uniref:Uncharacterized protein LOC107268394 isoform X2 n=1 Tax=Cephus cinctus TaxID=211228 RepID=A0AAJ7BX66_CEPCN|nr:uncharacterized protein LOC107268394 isoform X2 [Cephus cinctus]
MDYTIIIVFLSFVMGVVSETEILCTTSYCTSYITEYGCNSLYGACRAMNSTYHGTYLPYPAACNCCDYCLQSLNEGEICVEGLPGMLPPAEMCGLGLYCTANENNPATCQQLVSHCTNAQDEYDERAANGTLGSMEVRPLCDGEGDFMPAHCIPGSICYCVSPYGDRIFGEIPYKNPWDVEQMTCECSLNAWKAQNTLDPNYTVHVARCLSNGLFDPLQCMNGPNGTCLCVDSFTGSPRIGISTVTVLELAEDSPTCFDPTIHTNGTYDTDCEEQYNTILAAIDSYVAEGNTNHGLALPSCQPDGRYARVQISGSKKICVDPSGNQIESYEAFTNSTAADIMDCSILRKNSLVIETSRSGGITQLL